MAEAALRQGRRMGGHPRLYTGEEVSCLRQEHGKPEKQPDPLGPTALYPKKHFSPSSPLALLLK